MRIRLMGTEAEIAVVAERLATVLDVQEASDFYPNRGASKLGRVYLTVAVPATPPTVRADAERTDQTRTLPRSGRKEIR
ncbi:hypothetical protein [Amycolatopsis sp. YIM 10]|uniref:hypothetical protein n=1 Tax=Amycolatopsis sp. YIM 10 TaxID=2653857 RepID=UPI001290336F|nr:hypothetical protein [Amycolatopsis sp. YIM 10]QFU85721.1 hypothetical protein YIM_02480 [Amycolatopsis sp. YIM 10]